jgi:hypothetical protein
MFNFSTKSKRASSLSMRKSHSSEISVEFNGFLFDKVDISLDSKASADFSIFLFVVFPSKGSLATN